MTIDAKALLEGTTPGPWGAGVWHGAVKGTVSGQVFEGPMAAVFYEGGMIAPTGLVDGDPASLPNARLAAAAPDLARDNIRLTQELAELREALTSVEDRHRYAATMYHDATRWAGEDSPDPELSLLDYVFEKTRALLKDSTQ